MRQKVTCLPPACYWLTSAWRRATRPLFQAETPMASVPSTIAAPITYSIVASPGVASAKRRSRVIPCLPQVMREGSRPGYSRAMVKPVGTAVLLGLWDHRRPRAFLAARASLTPSARVVLFFDWPSMYADSMFTRPLPKRFAARASVPGRFARRTSITFRSLEMRYFFDLIARRALAASLSSMTMWTIPDPPRSEEHTSELQSLAYLVCRLLLEKKKKKT